MFLIQVLKLDHCHGLTKPGILQVIPEISSKLEELSLEGVSGLHPLHEITEHLPNLKILNLKNCRINQDDLLEIATKSTQLEVCSVKF